MNKKPQHREGYDYLLVRDAAVWVVILVHVLIMAGMILCFISIIHQLSNF